MLKNFENAHKSEIAEKTFIFGRLRGILEPFENWKFGSLSNSKIFLKVCIFNLKTLLYLMEKESVF
jgi:hypothetical protein